jgi:hypothetical protein
MRPGIGRGGRGDPVDVLTRGGRQRNRPESKGRWRCLRPARAPVGRRSGEQGGARRAGRAGHACRARGGGGHGPAWPMGLGGPGGWASAGACGPERVGPTGSAQSNRIGFFFFRIYF